MLFDVKRNIRYSQDGDTPPAVTPPTPTPEVKTFTQDDVNRVVTERLAKERDKYTRERAELIKKLGVENEEQIDSVLEKARKADEYATELETLKSEKALNERKQQVSKAGVDDDFIDYVLTKIPADDKFEENLKAFVEANPKYTKEVFAKLNAGLDLSGQGQKKPEDMTTAEFIEWRKTHNVDGTPIKKK